MAENRRPLVIAVVVIAALLASAALCLAFGYYFFADVGLPPPGTPGG